MTDIRVPEVSADQMERACHEAVTAILTHAQAWAKAGVSPDEVKGALMTTAAGVAGEIVGRTVLRQRNPKLVAKNTMGRLGAMIMQFALDYLASNVKLTEKPH